MKGLENKEYILLKDLDTNEIDYVFYIEAFYLEEAISYAKDQRANLDNLDKSDYEMIIEYLDKHEIEYSVSDFQKYKTMYY